VSAPEAGPAAGQEDVVAEIRARLVRLLQDSHAGELAAAYAYRGHGRSLRRRPAAQDELRRIEEAEWHHRAGVANMLAELGERPRRGRELAMGCIGRFFGLLCFLTGFFGPMYAAGRLEAMNVGQYEDARSMASELGMAAFADQLEAMRVEEDRHERFFGDEVRGHPLLPITSALLGWSPPPVDPTT